MKFKFSIVFAFLVVATFAQQKEKYSKVRIDFNPALIDEVFTLPFEFEHSTITKNSVELILSQEEMMLLNNTPFKYKVIIDDMSNYYMSQLTKSAKRDEFLYCNNQFYDSIKVPEQFNYGTMGGFLTYNQMLLELDSMAMNYPNLITSKSPIDTFLTYEGRPIYYVKISDNPNMDEIGESKVLYNALHHAREPISMMQLIFYMQYLLENYGTDEKVTHILNNHELYFVPCVNPDGYIYNETIAPNGGGLWRKNRRDNEDGTFGVDLNRNYGFEWGKDNIGSSPVSSSSTFRGVEPFSESETKAIRYLCNNHDFETTLNYHAYSNVLILPNNYTSDSLRFMSYSEVLTKDNHYTYGTGAQTLGYSTNGDSDAWMYNMTSNKKRQFAFTPEVGSNVDGFWPPESRIIPLCKENLNANINSVLMISNYVSIKQKSSYETNQTDDLTFEIQNFGLNTINNLTLRVQNTEYFESIDSLYWVGSLGDLERKKIKFDYKLSTELYESQLVPFEIYFDYNTFNRHERLTRIYTTQPPIYENTFDISLNDWDLDLWGPTDEDYVSSTHSITDSPYGNYISGVENELSLSKSIDLTNPEYVTAYLKFDAKWETEDGYDYAQLFIDDGITKTPMCGNYTNRGVGFTGQPDGEPLYDGVMRDWVTEYVNLDDFLGKVIDISLLMSSDGAIEKDGFYLDNFKVFAVKRELDPTIENPNPPKSINEFHSNKFNIFPNPVKDYLLINEANIVEVQVVNSIGQKVDVNNVISSDRTEIDVSNLAEGIYTLLIHSESSINTTHFIKR